MLSSFVSFEDKHTVAAATKGKKKKRKNKEKEAAKEENFPRDV